MSNLSTPIQYLPKVGPTMAKKFSSVGINTFDDLLHTFPRSYRDFTTPTPIVDISDELADRIDLDSNLTVKGNIIDIANKKTARRRFTVTEAIIADDTGSLKAVWFNQPFLTKTLHVGDEIILNGSIKYDRFSMVYSMESPMRATKETILPIYRETGGIKSFYIAKVVSELLKIKDAEPEWLPVELLDKLNLPDTDTALTNIHQPENHISLGSAKKRLAFDELFFISLRSQRSKEKRDKNKAPKIQTASAKIDSFVKNLPFCLTRDQERAIDEIISDLSLGKPMNRLLNGDVGSGKTIVAAIAAYTAQLSGCKTLFMCPTSILAEQHYQTFCRLFENFNLKIGLITSDKISVNRKNVIKNGESDLANCHIWIGTHALLYQKDPIEDVGLVIVDEQHRFGVKQRAKLTEITSPNHPDDLGPNHSNLPSAPFPHYLSMTATPIPRTMHLTLFGELDISIIKEKPKDRKEINTRFVEEFNRKKAYEFIDQQIGRGRQAFVICPLIEEKERQGTGDKELRLFEEDRKTVRAEYERLQKIFPVYRIGMLHGKLKPKEKDEIMDQFSNNQIQILVSTSVVEVGIDVPNATVMMIENAERFGLAQIHQFRGRVGRGEHQSFCFLFSSSVSQKLKERMHRLETTSDGFELAKYDLETRGAGSIFGLEQSGLLDLKMATLTDIDTMNLAVKSAKEILPSIDKYPKIIEKLDQFETTLHME